MKLPSFRQPPAKRSENMRAIISTGNRTTEWRLRSFLVRAGIKGWSLGKPKELGSPDFLFERRRVVVFVDGCFWHGCPTCGHIPKTNQAYWKAKITRNRKRDRATTATARAQGYKVVRIWECALKDQAHICMKKICTAVGRSERQRSY